MTEPCKYCGSDAVAAVLDKKIEESTGAGNKFRQRCLNCRRWLPCCKAAVFQAADERHVLPVDADRDGDDPTIPVEEYDGDVEGTKTASDSANSTDAAADGLRSDGGGQVNSFNCPNCGDHVTGYPEECPNCGAGYDWDASGDDSGTEDT